MDDLGQVRMIGGMAGYELAVRATEMVAGASNEKMSSATIEKKLQGLIREVFEAFLKPHLDLITRKESLDAFAQASISTFNEVFPRLSGQGSTRIWASPERAREEPARPGEERGKVSVTFRKP